MVPDSGSSVHSSEAAFSEKRAHSVIFLQGVLLSHCGRKDKTIQMQVDIQYENRKSVQNCWIKKKKPRGEIPPYEMGTNWNGWFKKINKNISHKNNFFKNF